MEEKRQNETIFDLYLSCHTETEIADKTGLSRDTIHSKMDDLLKTFPGTNTTKLSKYDDDSFFVHNLFITRLK